jgi:iron(III) transport system permease protein
MGLSFLKRYNLVTLIFLVLLIAFFGLFLIYPIINIFKGAFLTNGWTSFKIIITDKTHRTYVFNSFKIGFTVTILTTLLSLPPAYLLVRYRFWGKGVMRYLILVPMIMPPFFGAFGMKQLFSEYGSVNLFLHLIDNPIDWFGNGFRGVVLLETLHLYPIMYLSVAGALATVYRNLEEESPGTSRFHLFRTVFFPLISGYFAGAIIVFTWAFTDLGTPLIFEYRQVIPVGIFFHVDDINANSMGYALAILVIFLTFFLALCFYLSKKFVGRGEMRRREHISSYEVEANPITAVVIYLFVGALIFIAILPHISVFLTSLTPSANEWFMSILPKSYTLRHYWSVFTQKDILSGIGNSLFYSVCSTIATLFLGVITAYLLRRKQISSKNVSDITMMLPIALPGVALAFGYVGSFAGSPINTAALLIISYTVRRFPYMVQAAYEGFQEDEVSQDFGSSLLGTLDAITHPVTIRCLASGALFSFSSSMLEVSNSLIISRRSQYSPITQAVYYSGQGLGVGPCIAAAMGILGMILLTLSLVVSVRFFGKHYREWQKIY